MTVGMGIHVVTSGPFFTGATQRQIEHALRDTLQDVTERGESITKRQLFPGHGFVTGTLRRSIAGEVINSRNTLVKTNVVYGAWIEGTSRRNATTRFKGYHMFRKATQSLNRSWPRLLSRHLGRRRR
jgi:hypothetical protein|tara:strand:+ start:4048 stop:4428 length:381 start_codon:yes stop_codon:yes gene_type:complete